MNSELLKKSIVYGLSFLFFLIPNLVLGSYFFPFIFPKIIFAALIIQILFILYLFYFIKERKLNFNIKKSLIIFALYFIALIVSSIFGADFYQSFWGNAERMEGLYFLINFLLLLAILTQILEEKSNLMIILRSFLLGTLLTFIYVVLQALNFSGFGVVQGLQRFSSSLGNSALFSSYLIFSFWFGIYAFYIDIGKYWKVFYLFITIFSFAFIILAQTRASFLGIVIASMIVLFILGFRAKNINIKKTSIFVFLGLVILLSIIFIFRSSHFIKSLPAISRVSSISLNDSTTASRLVSAKISLNGFLERPVFGWGINNFFNLYTKYYDPKNLTNDPQFFDKPHNKYLEILTEDGILGFVIYAAFIVYLLSIIIKNLDNEKLIVLGAFITYLFQNAFIFDTPSTYLGFIFLFAIISRYEKPTKKISFELNNNLNIGLSILIAVSTIYIFSLFYFLNAGAQAIEVLQGIPYRIEDKAYVSSTLNSFIDKNTFISREILINLAGNNLARIPPNPNNIESIKLIYEKVKVDFDNRPDNYRLGIALLKILNQISSLDTNYNTAFISYSDKVIKLAPKRPEAYYETGVFYFRNNAIEQAKQQYLNAVSLNEKYVQPYWFFGVLLFLAHQYTDSQFYIEKAINMGYNYLDPQSLRIIIEVYKNNNNLQKANKYIDIAKANFPSLFTLTTTPSVTSTSTSTK